MRIWIAILAASLCAAAPAQAQSLWAGRDAVRSSQPVESIAPQDLMVLLDSMDIEAQLAALPAGREAHAHPLGVTARTDGLFWDAVFYNCAGQGPALPAGSIPGAEGDPELRPARGCRDFALSAAFDLEFPVSVQTINRFNREYRFARATLTDDGAPALQMDVNLEGGVSREALIVEVEAWRALLVAFARYVGY